MAKLNGFCRYNQDPNSVDFELIKRAVIWEGADNQVKVVRGGLGSPSGQILSPLLAWKDSAVL